MRSKDRLGHKLKNRIVDLERYSGKWVAFIDNQPVAFACDLVSLMQKIKKSSFSKEPSVMLVPRKDEGPYILLLRV